MKFTTNMGTADRLIRTLLALLMITIYFTLPVSHTIGLLLIGVAIVFLLTSFVSFCPLYLPFRIHTKKKKQ